MFPCYTSIGGNSGKLAVESGNLYFFELSIFNRQFRKNGTLGSCNAAAQSSVFSKLPVENRKFEKV
jgi:hypothetical protein